MGNPPLIERKSLISSVIEDLEIICYNDHLIGMGETLFQKAVGAGIEEIYWPVTRIRKYELIDYYISVSDYILPYLKGRPQNLHWHPNGIDSKGFYQKKS